MGDGEDSDYDLLIRWMKENKGIPQRQLLFNFFIFGLGEYMMIVVTATKEKGVTDFKYEVKLSVPFKKAVNTHKKIPSQLWSEMSSHKS